MISLIFFVWASVYAEPQLLPNGKQFNKYGLTAASRDLPFGTCIRVNNKVNVLINDRGPCFSKECQNKTPQLLKRKLDLSLGTALKLGYGDGVHKVEYQIVDKRECERR